MTEEFQMLELFLYSDFINIGIGSMYQETSRKSDTTFATLKIISSLHIQSLWLESRVYLREKKMIWVKNTRLIWKPCLDIGANHSFLISVKHSLILSSSNFLKIFFSSLKFTWFLWSIVWTQTARLPTQLKCLSKWIWSIPRDKTVVMKTLHNSE